MERRRLGSFLGLPDFVSASLSGFVQALRGFQDFPSCDLPEIGFVLDLSFDPVSGIISLQIRHLQVWDRFREIFAFRPRFMP